MRQLLLRVCAALVALAASLPAQGPAVLDDSVPPGANFAIAQFRFWAPPGAGRIRAVAVLVPGSNAFKAHVWTPRFNIQYDINPDTMIYATISKGYRAGGFNSLVVANPSIFGSSYRPETAWSYEAGLKAQAFDRKAQLNVAAYYETLSDLQTLADAGGGSHLIEQLTDEVAQAGWSLFGELDADGGIVAAPVFSAAMPRLLIVLSRRFCMAPMDPRRVLTVSIAVSRTLMAAFAPDCVVSDCAVERLAIERPVVLADVNPKVISSTELATMLFGPTWNCNPVARPAPFSNAMVLNCVAAAMRSTSERS